MALGLPRSLYFLSLSLSLSLTAICKKPLLLASVTLRKLRTEQPTEVKLDANGTEPTTANYGVSVQSAGGGKIIQQNERGKAAI